MAMMVETNLRRLATQVEEGCDKKLDYNLPPMNKKERLFVHELSDFYNITSQGRDIEPNRWRFWKLNLPKTLELDILH